MTKKEQTLMFIRKMQADASRNADSLHSLIVEDQKEGQTLKKIPDDWLASAVIWKTTAAAIGEVLKRFDSDQTQFEEKK